MKTDLDKVIEELFDLSNIKSPKDELAFRADIEKIYETEAGRKLLSQLLETKIDKIKIFYNIKEVPKSCYILAEMPEGLRESSFLELTGISHQVLKRSVIMNDDQTNFHKYYTKDGTVTTLTTDHVLFHELVHARDDNIEIIFKGGAPKELNSIRADKDYIALYQLVAVNKSTFGVEGREMVSIDFTNKYLTETGQKSRISHDGLMSPENPNFSPPFDVVSFVGENITCDLKNKLMENYNALYDQAILHQVDNVEGRSHVKYNFQLKAAFENCECVDTSIEEVSIEQFFGAKPVPGAEIQK